MPVIEEIIHYLNENLHYRISKKSINKLYQHFYPELNDNVYWSIDINESSMTFFFDGVISKEDYKKICEMDKKTEINFGEISKHCEATAYIEELKFTTDKDEIVIFYDGNNHNEFELILFFKENELWNFDE